MGRVEVTVVVDRGVSLVLEVFNVRKVVVVVDATGVIGKVVFEAYELGGGAGTPPTPFWLTVVAPWERSPIARTKPPINTAAATSIGTRTAR